MNTAPLNRSDFATRLYDKLAGTQAGKNLFLSPFSIQVAVAMCAAGAKGETRRVLAELIGAPESVAEQNRQYADLLLGAEVAREMIEAGEYEDVVSKWAGEHKRRWEKSKFFKLWEKEKKAGRDPRKAFMDR